MKSPENLPSAAPPAGVRPPHCSHASLDSALANHAHEGLYPGPEALEDLRKVADGEMTGDEYRTNVRARYGN